jgi:hypothetical protein
MRVLNPCISSLPTPGISFKTQALYVTVFVSRYLDLFTTWISLYNFIMKIFFIGSSIYILYLMKVRFRYVHTHPFHTFSFPLPTFVQNVDHSHSTLHTARQANA